jgi:hypothetical protein
VTHQTSSIVFGLVHKRASTTILLHNIRDHLSQNPMIELRVLKPKPGFSPRVAEKGFAQVCVDFYGGVYIQIKNSEKNRDETTSGSAADKVEVSIWEDLPFGLCELEYSP